jgi:hypothetical protein
MASLIEIKSYSSADLGRDLCPRIHRMVGNHTLGTFEASFYMLRGDMDYFELGVLETRAQWMIPSHSLYTYT